jgi:hypothetical protein
LTVTNPTTGAKSTAEKRIDPQTVALTFKTNPAGLKVSLGNDFASTASPFTVTEVVGHAMTAAATSPQTLKSGTYYWQSWSNGGPNPTSITAPAAATTYTATYRKK